jgi:predicted transcriptional regulator
METAEVLRGPVRSIMEPDVFAVPVDMPLLRVAAELAERQIGGAAACTSRGAIIGVISKTDLAESFGPAGQGQVAGDVMTPDVISVGPDEPIERAIELMVFEGVHRLLVVDAGGTLAGIVSAMDVLRALAGAPRRSQRVVAVAPPAEPR